VPIKAILFLGVCNGRVADERLQHINIDGCAAWPLSDEFGEQLLQTGDVLSDKVR